MNKSKLEGHVEHLEQHHDLLDKKIKEGYTFYLADEYLGKMKHEKLIIKRQLEEIQKQLKVL